jgi:predicted transcriptional regulator
MKKIENYIKNETNYQDGQYEIITTIIAKRNEMHLSQRDLAKLTGIKQPIIAKLEKGVHSPTLKTLLTILNALNLKIIIK